MDAKIQTTMNGENYLLDTNIIIASFAGEKSVNEKIDAANKIFIPIIVVGELFFGAAKSSKKSDNIKKIKEFVKGSIIIEFGVKTAEIQGLIKKGLRKKGNPIPENDIWIAAIAQNYNYTLVTRDKHFVNVEGIDVELWQ